MKATLTCLIVVLSLGATCAAAQADEPISTSAAAKQDKHTAAVHGKVIEVRRVAGGPIIFELDGKPGAPAFRALVYPMAVARFEFLPETRYLGKMVEVSGLVVVRKDLPQMWINDPSAIRLLPDQPGSETLPSPAQ